MSTESLLCHCQYPCIQTQLAHTPPPRAGKWNSHSTRENQPCLSSFSLDDLRLLLSENIHHQICKTNHLDMRRQFCNLPVSKRALYMHRLGSVDDVLITDYFNQQRKTAIVYYHLDGHFIFKLRSSCSMPGILQERSEE